MFQTAKIRCVYVRKGEDDTSYLYGKHANRRHYIITCILHSSESNANYARKNRVDENIKKMELEGVRKKMSEGNFL